MDVKVIVVTGGANGLGLAMAETFLAEGNNVAILDVDIGPTSIEHQRYIDFGSLLITKCDVTNAQDVKTAIAAVIDKWDKIDILINNAAQASFKLFEYKTLEEMQREFDINYFGYLRMIKEVLPHMHRNNAGTIYNVSSLVGLVGFVKLSGYTSTKGAIESLTKTLALELKDSNVNIGIIHPPLMKTESAIPLGIPHEIMEDPDEIGKSIVLKILYRRFKSVVTSNLTTGIFTKLSYKYPRMIGNLLDRLTNSVQQTGGD